MKTAFYKYIATLPLPQTPLTGNIPYCVDHRRWWFFLFLAHSQSLLFLLTLEQSVSALDAINLGSQPQPASAPTFPAQLSPQRPLRVKFPSPCLCPAWMMCSLAMFAVPTSDFFFSLIYWYWPRAASDWGWGSDKSPPTWTICRGWT